MMVLRYDWLIWLSAPFVMGLWVYRVLITTLLMCGSLNFDAILYFTFIYWPLKIYHLLKDFMKDMQNGFIYEQEFIKFILYLIMNSVLLFKFMV